jgi:hypothetical protein
MIVRWNDLFVGRLAVLSSVCYKIGVNDKSLEDRTNKHHMIQQFRLTGCLTCTD